MNRICRFSIAVTVAGLAGCVGYGYPGSDYGYPSDNQGYPSGGQGYPDYGYPNSGDYGNGGNGGTFRCESDDGRTRHCNADTRGGVRINRQLSDSACIQGRNWGYDNSGVWVSQGCRAEFVVGAGGGYNPGNGSYPGRARDTDKPCAANRRTTTSAVATWRSGVASTSSASCPIRVACRDRTGAGIAAASG